MNAAQDPEVDAVRRAYAAFAAGDIEAAVADVADDVIWIEPDEFPNGGLHRGREAVRAYLRESRAMWQHLRSAATVFRRGERMIAHHHVDGILLDGRRQEVTVADVYTFDHGRVVHMQAYATPAEVPL